MPLWILLTFQQDVKKQLKKHKPIYEAAKMYSKSYISQFTIKMHMTTCPDLTFMKKEKKKKILRAQFNISVKIYHHNIVDFCLSICQYDLLCSFVYLAAITKI